MTLMAMNRQRPVTVHEQVTGNMQVANQMKLDERYQIETEAPQQLRAFGEAQEEAVPMETDEQMVEGMGLLNLKEF